MFGEGYGLRIMAPRRGYITMGLKAGVGDTKVSTGKGNRIFCSGLEVGGVGNRRDQLQQGQDTGRKD